MDFLAPNAFWFALALPVIVVFYLLKRKRVVKLVSSTLLWQRFLAEQQANAPFQKLRKNWLLFLQLLLLALIVFALSRPFFTGTAKESRKQVIILDASASMKSTDVSPSRFEQAREQALEWVNGLRDNDEMVVLVAGSSTEVKQSATSEKSALRRAIESARPTDSTTRLDEALRLAETLIQDQADAEIHLFSDGAIPFPEGFENRSIPLVYHQIGSGNRNVGITALDVRANPENPLQRAIFANVSNVSSNEFSVDLELTFNGEAAGFESIVLEPKENRPLVFVADQSENGFFTLTLNVEDDLEADNEASIMSLLPQPVKVLLVSSGNRFLEKALGSIANVELAIAGDLEASREGFDFVVVDSVNPVSWPEGNILAINTFRTNWFESIGTIEQPPIVDWRATHPLLRFVGFDNVYINQALAVPPPSWGIPIVESPQTPLILAGEFDRQRILWIGFDTLESTWPLRVSFPIFIANAVDWLNPTTTQNEMLTVQAGSPFRFQLESMENSMTVQKPDGTELELPVNTNTTEVVFGETSQRGVYRLQYGTNELAFSVNLTDAAESDIAPRPELPFGQAGITRATETKQANLELWRWIALCGLAMLMFEWWFYHKRTA